MLILVFIYLQEVLHLYVVHLHVVHLHVVHQHVIETESDLTQFKENYSCRLTDKKGDECRKIFNLHVSRFEILRD